MKGDTPSLILGTVLIALLLLVILGPAITSIMINLRT
jgi:hypothetical protein